MRRATINDKRIYQLSMATTVPLSSENASYEALSPLMSTTRFPAKNEIDYGPNPRIISNDAVVCGSAKN
jgi:hypothetical protein